MSDDRFDRVTRLYESAVFGADTAAAAEADAILDTVEADLLLHRGKILHSRHLLDRDGVDAAPELPMFTRAAALYRAAGDTAGEAEAEFWTGCYLQVAAGDTTTAVAHFEAALTGTDLTRSYALRHLAFAAQHDGRITDAIERMHESTALRRTLGLTAGVAANLVALAFLNLEAGDTTAARAFADEAAALAESVDAAAVRGWAAEAAEAIAAAE